MGYGKRWKAHSNDLGHLLLFIVVTRGGGHLAGILPQRGTYISAHAWIFFKFCILITHYIQTMKMYLSN